VHSFAFYSVDGKQKVYHFLLSRITPATHLLEKILDQNDIRYAQTSGTTQVAVNEYGGLCYCINIVTLKRKFEDAMEGLKNEIKKNGHFEEMAKKYGQINIRTDTAS